MTLNCRSYPRREIQDYPKLSSSPTPLHSIVYLRFPCSTIDNNEILRSLYPNDFCTSRFSNFNAAPTAKVDRAQIIETSFSSSEGKTSEPRWLPKGWRLARVRSGFGRGKVKAKGPRKRQEIKVWRAAQPLAAGAIEATRPHAVQTLHQHRPKTTGARTLRRSRQRATP